MRIAIMTAALAATIGLAAPASASQQGAFGGAVTGGAAGAIVGGPVGFLVGAGAGAVVGNAVTAHPRYYRGAYYAHPYYHRYREGRE